MKMQNLHEAMLDMLKDTYDAEHQITKALPKMIEAAKNRELKKAFETHLRQTEEQIRMVERIFETLGEKPSRKKCDGMAGLIKEGEHVIEEGGDPDVVDAFLRVEAEWRQIAGERADEAEESDSMPHPHHSRDGAA